MNFKAKIKKLDSILTKAFFNEYYTNKRMSLPQIGAMISEEHGICMDDKTVWQRATNHGIKTRSKSEANTVRSACDYSKTFINEKMIEAIDGFLLGDGGIKYTKTCAALVCCVKYEEFCEYLMSFFKCYIPTVKPYSVKDKRIKGGVTHGFRGRTKYHPDIWKQYKRWYPNGGKKQVPKDVRITPLSTMLWYLGDGSFRKRGAGEITLCTNGFNDASRQILVNKLLKNNIKLTAGSQGAMCGYGSSVISVFNFIGWKSPIKCYNYKFTADKELKGMISLRYLLSVNKSTNNLLKSKIIRKYNKDWIPVEYIR